MFTNRVETKLQKAAVTIQLKHEFEQDFQDWAYFATCRKIYTFTKTKMWSLKCKGGIE